MALPFCCARAYCCPGLRISRPSLRREKDVGHEMVRVDIRPGAIKDSGPVSDIPGHGRRFGDLLLGRAQRHRGMAMIVGAVFPPDLSRPGESDQLHGLGVERTFANFTCCIQAQAPATMLSG